jgi:hypothetical protein
MNTAKVKEVPHDGIEGMVTGQWFEQHHLQQLMRKRFNQETKL